MQLILTLLDIILPVVIIGLIGFFWIKKGYEFPRKFMTNIIMNLGAPCLIFSGFMKLKDNLEQASIFMAASAVAIIFFLILSFIFAHLTKLPKRTYVPAIFSHNAGNLGTPLCFFAFGEIGLILALTFFAIDTFVQYTAGLATVHKNLSFKEVSKIPFLYSFVIALLLLWLEIEPPLWVMNSTQLLGQITIPLMILMLGTSLASFKLKQSSKLILISIFKITVGIAVGFGVSLLFNFTGVERNILILQMSMPAAIFSYMLAAQYNQNPEEVASLICISTLISFISIPLLLTWMIGS